MKLALFIILTTLTNLSYASFPIQESEVPENMPFHLQILIGLIVVAFFWIVYYFYKRYRSYDIIKDEQERVRKKRIFKIIIALMVLGLVAFGMASMSPTLN